MNENLQCTSKCGHLRISQDICHVRMTDIEGFLTIYGHSDNLLNNKYIYIPVDGQLNEGTWILIQICFVDQQGVGPLIS